MDSDVIQRFRRLPRRPDRTWQGKFLRMIAWVTDEQGNLFRPIMPLWVDASDRSMSELRAVRPEEASASCLLSSLVVFAVEDRQFRPGCIQVTDPALAQHLQTALAGCEIDIRLVEQMVEMDEVEVDLAKLHRRGTARIDSLLDTPGVAVEQVRGFAEAAAAFYRAQPWLHLCEDDLIRIHTPTPPPGMKHVAVFGADRELYGIGLRDTPQDHFRYCTQKSGWQDMPLWQLSYGQVAWIPIEDANLWEDYELATAGPQAYPRIVKYEGSEVVRPSARQLVFLEGLLQVLAAATVEQIDRGRWTKTVLRSDGVRAKYTLSIPDLIRPATPQQWMMRGYKPDPRINDQLRMMLELYSEQRLASVLVGADMLLRGTASGVSYDGIGIKPETPAEMARALCYQAIETFGRRTRQLAQQALQHDPDCIEAHVILGEMSPTLDVQLLHYQRAVAVGEDWVPGQLSRQDDVNVWAVTTDESHLRARMGLAMTFDELGQLDDAIQQFQQLLQLDPEDHQGARYLLLPRLMATNRDVEAARLLKAYREHSTQWAYAQAILAFRLSGSSDAARREIRAALTCNPHVPKVLTAVSPPVVTDGSALGSPEDATICIEELLPVLTATPGVVQWIVSEHRLFQREQAQKDRPQQRATRKGRTGQ